MFFSEIYAVKVHTTREQTDSEAVRLNAEGSPVKKKKNSIVVDKRSNSSIYVEGKSGLIRFALMATKKINCQAIMKKKKMVKVKKLLIK